MFGIGYLQIEGIIAAMGGLSDREMIRRRFKYLQRMSYPPGTNTGRGRKAVLELEQVLQVIMAVELMQVGASPTRAIRILRTNWNDLRPALALGWLVSWKPVFSPLRALLVMNAGALEDAGGSEDPNHPVSQPLRPCAALDLIVGLTRDQSITRVVLDPARLAHHLFEHTKSPDAGFTASELETAYVVLWMHSQDRDPEEWMSQAIRDNKLADIETRLTQLMNPAPQPDRAR